MEYRKILCAILLHGILKKNCASVPLLTQFPSRRRSERIPAKNSMPLLIGYARTAPFSQANSLPSPEPPTLYLPVYLLFFSHPLHLFLLPPLINHMLACRRLMRHTNSFCLRCFLTCSAAGPRMQCRACISRLHSQTLIHSDFHLPPPPSPHDPPTPPFRHASARPAHPPDRLPELIARLMRRPAVTHNPPDPIPSHPTVQASQRITLQR